MLSGFILKADADSLQAKRIIADLLQTIPIAGKILSTTFLGKEGDFQLIYVHHISTATIILLIAVYDHVRTIWVKISTLLITLIIISFLSYFFEAGLQTQDEIILKGPWYFVGTQEILYHLNNPGFLILLTLLVFLLFYFLPVSGQKNHKNIKILYLILLSVYLILSIIGYYFRGENWKWQLPGDKNYKTRSAFKFKTVNFNGNVYKLFVVQGRTEGCLSCHYKIKGLSDSHNPLQTGCYTCHRGDPFTLNKNQAHLGMEKVPGNLSNAALSCGSATCHAGINYRVANSLMSRLSGIISVDRFVFGETKDQDNECSLENIAESPADKHLKNLCVGCHLGNEKTIPGPAAWLDRGGGCNACHLTYTKEARLELAQIKSKSDINPRFHPNIDLSITNDKCQSCHSRSGRISMSYEGWHETNLTENQVSKKQHFKILPDKRVFEFISPDVHHQKGMACIDCHGSYELMGDGKHYLHKEDAVNIQCIDCHSLTTDNIAAFNEIDNESRLIAVLRGLKVKNNNVIFTEKNKRPLINTQIESDGSKILVTKLTSLKLPLKPPSATCNEGKVHSRLSCEACHTSWVPQCIGCHNSYEPETEGWDMLNLALTKGCWVEYSGKYFADKPVLGIRNNQVYTMSPGMILSVDKKSFNEKSDTIWKRLYAPASGHTTQKKGRSCKSCHNDPIAIGYGRGELRYTIKENNGRWSFKPQFINTKFDGIPEDAWIPFLKERKGITSTRKNIRPFNLIEQRKILTVGSCLSCHQENSSEIRRSLKYPGLAGIKLSVKCILPEWE